MFMLLIYNFIISSFCIKKEPYTDAVYVTQTSIENLSLKAIANPLFSLPFFKEADIKATACGLDDTLGGKILFMYLRDLLPAWPFLKIAASSTNSWSFSISSRSTLVYTRLGAIFIPPHLYFLRI